jgi:hypothetical protein
MSLNSGLETASQRGDDETQAPTTEPPPPQVESTISSTQLQEKPPLSSSGAVEPLNPAIAVSSKLNVINVKEVSPSLQYTYIFF